MQAPLLHAHTHHCRHRCTATRPTTDHRTTELPTLGACCPSPSYCGYQLLPLLQAGLVPAQPVLHLLLFHGSAAARPRFTPGAAHVSSTASMRFRTSMPGWRPCYPPSSFGASGRVPSDQGSGTNSRTLPIRWIRLSALMLRPLLSSLALGSGGCPKALPTVPMVRSASPSPQRSGLFWVRSPLGVCA